MSDSLIDADILRYIIEHQVKPGERLPTISELSAELDVSVSKIREELEVARALGFVQIKPRTGTQVQDFDFGPAAKLSVLYALGLDRSYFHDLSQLRIGIELHFWHEAVALLCPNDITHLRQVVSCAFDKLNRIPIEVPFKEHRDLHLTFFKHLSNPFVQGLLEAYWVAYQAFGLAFFAELSYHRQVWGYHERMVECVARGDLDGGHQALAEHMTLLRRMPIEAEASTASSNSPKPGIYLGFE